jgi:UDP-3-O-[3-hydroxymyristoyl] glucosamine N-acyltransferase
MSLTLGELAVRFGCELRGDPQLQVTRVATLATAEAGALAFLANPQYRDQLASTRATVVVLDPQSAAGCPVAALVHANPYATYARVAALLYPMPAVAAGIAPGASVAPGAMVHPSAQVGAAAVIADGARVGERSVVGPGCVIAQGAALGADCCLRSRVTLEYGVQLGDRVLVHAGAVIGADGFGFARDGKAWTKVPQLGSVRIGNDVEIGANTTIDRGAIDDTVIGDGVKIDNLVQVGHNCVIGNHTVIAAFVGISGSTRLGQRCMIGGAVGFAGHLDICDDVAVTGKSFVARSIDKPGIYSSGIPAEPAPRWRRLVARIRRLDTMAIRLTRLERHSGIAVSADSEEEKNDD